MKLNPVTHPRLILPGCCTACDMGDDSQPQSSAFTWLPRHHTLRIFLLPLGCFLIVSSLGSSFPVLSLSPRTSSLFLPFPSQSLKPISQAYSVQFSSVQSISRVRLCDPMDCSMPGFPVHHQLPELTQLMSIELVMPSNHLLLCRPLLLLPSIFPSIRVFSSESVLRIRWPKYWSYSFSISPYNEYLGLISFRMNWLDLLAVQGTLKSLLQHHTQLRLMTPNKYPTQASLPCEPSFVTHCPPGITMGASKRVNIPVQAAVQSEIQFSSIPCLPSLPWFLSPILPFSPNLCHYFDHPLIST